MDFWKNVQVAAEKAASVAKDFGKKGLVSALPPTPSTGGPARNSWGRPVRETMQIGYRRCSRSRYRLPHKLTSPPCPPLQEAVEATAEEASKKLNLNLHDKVGAGPATQNALPQAELEAFGITPEFGEFVRTLNYR